MRKITLLLALVFTVTFSSPSFADWTEVDKNVSGDTFYVDFERIRKHGGYVYFWYLSDLLKPIERGILSAKTYKQGDCKLFRYKDLSVFWHKEPMGGGTGKPYTPPDKWYYPPPDTVGETILNKVCEYAN